MMKKGLLAALLGLFMFAAMADVVAPPTSNPVTVTFTVTWSAPTTGGTPTSYAGGWLLDGAALGSFETTVDSLMNSRDINVENGQEVCARVNGRNSAGQGETWEECVTVDWLLEVPGAPQNVTISHS